MSGREIDDLYLTQLLTSEEKTMSEPNQTSGLDTVRGDVSDALSELLEFSDALARLMEGTGHGCRSA